MKNFEDEEVKLDEEEVNWLDSFFGEGKESLGNINSGGKCSFEWFPNSEEEEWAGRWLISILE